MSAGLICDNCGTNLPLERNRSEASNGEDAAWIVIKTRGYGTQWDACTRSCAAALLESGPLAEQIDAELQSIAEIARAINGDEDDAS